MVDFEVLFPRLRGSQFQITSPPTQLYNCIAWAAGDDTRWWWPDIEKKRYWPAGVPRAETLESFISAYETVCFVHCDNKTLEAGFEKIAIFVHESSPQHAARQLSNGLWTSKLGELHDIEHDLHDLEGIDYGVVVALMKRPLR